MTSEDNEDEAYEYQSEGEIGPVEDEEDAEDWDYRKL